jgi:hypothetical protein
LRIELRIVDRVLLERIVVSHHKFSLVAAPQPATDKISPVAASSAATSRISLCTIVLSCLLKRAFGESQRSVNRATERRIVRQIANKHFLCRC